MISQSHQNALKALYVVDMIMQVLNGPVISDRDPVEEERVHDRLAANVAKGGTGCREINQSLNSFGHWANVAFIAVGSVDKLHHDVADRPGGDFPREKNGRREGLAIHSPECC